MSFQEVLDFFSQIPTWAYMLLAVAVALGVWHFLPTDIRLLIKKLFKNPVTYIILFGVIWYCWNQTGEVLAINSADYYMPFVAFIILIAINMAGNMRYLTPQVTTPNFHGSFTEAISESGFVLLNVGAFNALGISVPMAQKILIVREETFKLMEQSGFSIARVAPVDFSILPIEVESRIEKTWFLKNAKENCYFGWFDDINQVDYEMEDLIKLELEKSKSPLNIIKKELNIENPSVLDIAKYAEHVCHSYNHLKGTFRDSIDDSEEGLEHIRRKQRVFKDKDERNNNPSGGEQN